LYKSLGIEMGYKIGVDVGGTFTDFLLVDDDGASMIFKTPSTPQDPSLGVINGFQEMAFAQKVDLQQFLPKVDIIVHGTTITTNMENGFSQPSNTHIFADPPKNRKLLISMPWLRPNTWFGRIHI